MPHHLYQTKAFILEGRPYGEAGKAFTAFTRDFGLIRATAQGVRLSKSKLRYALQEFSFVDLVLVRGRADWRITGALKIDNLYERLQHDSKTILVFARVFALLRRLVHGEEKNEALFNQLEKAFLFFSSVSAPAPELVFSGECLLVLRILHVLGYIGHSPDTMLFIDSPEWCEEVLFEVGKFRRQILSEINQSLRETQL